MISYRNLSLSTIILGLVIQFFSSIRASCAEVPLCTITGILIDLSSYACPQAHLRMAPSSLGGMLRELLGELCFKCEGTLQGRK